MWSLVSPMPRPLTPGSIMTTTMTNENRPVWCSPGYSRSTMIRAAKSKPLTEAKSGNQVSSENKVQQQEVKPDKAVTRKKPPLEQDTMGALTAETKAKRAASPNIGASGVQNTTSAVSTSRPKSTSGTKALPLVEDTPPRSRPLKKAPAVLVTPTNKSRKPLASLGTPKGNILKGGTPKGTSSKGFTPKGSSPSGRTRSRERSCRTTDDTPSSRKVKERPFNVSAPQEGPRSGKAREKIQQTLSAWPSSAVGSGGGRAMRKASPAQGRPPVKHLFLSPQGSKKTNRKDFMRMSMDNHGIWIGSVPYNPRNRFAARKPDHEPEMPPPAQPTNSPEIPKRGSREASGEGIRGYFGAGPMVAPDGLGGVVRDRRKCKPRGMLMVGDEGLSMESDSSGAVEASTQIPLPSVASVEWMNKTVAVASITDIPSSCSSGKLRSDSTSLSEYFMIHDNEARESALRNDISIREVNCDGLFLQQLRQSRINTKLSNDYAEAIAFHQKNQGRRSKTIGQRSRQSLRAGSSSLRGQPSGDDDPGCISKEDDDSTIDWREGLPYESLEMVRPRSSRDASKDEERLARSSISFTSSWVRPTSVEKSSGSSEGLVGSASKWTASDSPWYGFSPITPEFQRVSQLPESASKAIDALMAVGSVRRRIMTDQSASSLKASGSSTSLAESMQLVDGDNSPSCSGSPSAMSSLEASSSFQFAAIGDAARNIYSPTAKYLGAATVMEDVPPDSFVCQTSSPVGQSTFGDDLLCQTASPIDDMCYDSSADCPNVDNHVADYSFDCSVGCSLDRGEEGCCSSGDCSVDVDGIGGFADDQRDGSEDDEVEYASPIMGDYLSPQKPCSPSAMKFENSSTGLIEGCGDFGQAVTGLRGGAGRRSSIRRSSISRSSISKTLEELMRHNFSL